MLNAEGAEEPDWEEDMEDNTHEVFKACSTSSNSIIEEGLSAKVQPALVNTLL